MVTTGNCALLKTAGLVLLLSAWSLVSRAQDVPEFNMSDTTITICTGILYDSGGEDGLYNNNEQLTTVIQPGGIITLTFQNIFNVEPSIDFLTIYDGPDAGSPLLGQFSGTTLPPQLTATSGSVTLVFTSDNSAIYAGFQIYWVSDNPPPVPPNIAVNNPPQCNTTSLAVQFSYPVQCAWLEEAEWTISSNGQDLPVAGVDDQCVNDETSEVILTLTEPFTFNCDYELELVIGIPDDCDLIYIFTVTSSFTYGGCGIAASISASSLSVCPGNCATITAVVDGCLGYTYEWDNGLPPTAGPHSVCPLAATTYSVTITENGTGNVQTFSFTLLTETTGISTPDQEICQSVPLMDLDASVNGIWSGTGILDEELGLFEPDSAAAGLNIIYFDTGTCIDSVLLTVIPISTDNITAACPGTVPFQLNAQPPGGLWDGPFTTGTGTFDPSTEGSYLLTYTTAECTDTLYVNVGVIEGITTLDTICQSVPFDTIAFSPLGGYWSGQGVADSLLGIYEPGEMNPGWVDLLYTINGCAQPFEVFVKEIDIGPGFTSVCPVQAPMVFYEDAPVPPGGYWAGQGVIDTATGLFDPSILPNDFYTSVIYYAPNGCSDTTFIYNRQTEIGLSALSLCLSDDPYELIRENIHHAPHYGGIWSGAGLSNPDEDYWLFDPGAAGVGVHVLTYLKNECEDSLIVTVFPDQLTTATLSFCSSEDPMLAEENLQPGGFWYGNGIINSQTGLFDPGVATPGSFYIYWLAPAGCADSIAVSVEASQVASISGLNETYCFTDSDLPVTIHPATAIITGPVNAGQFNPSLAGEGIHIITAAWNGLYCSSSDTLEVNVYPPIQTQMAISDSVICGGAATSLSVNASGGNPDLLFSYAWSDNSFPVNTNTVSPSSSSMIYVVVSDGCSDPATDSAFITVLPPLDYTVTTSTVACYGLPGYATAEVNTPGSFEITWNEIVSDSVIDIAGTSHDLVITDLVNGCTRDSLVLIPNYPPIVAAFSFNPSLACIPYDDKDRVAIIDLSQNATNGEWDYGNGITAPYEAGTTPEPVYPGSGEYVVSLVVYNIGNCPDSTSATICVLPATPIFVPDIFSPNDDGFNDVLFVRSQGIVSLDFMVYNRWGEVVFESKDIRRGWDGQHRGEPSPSGNYLYYLSAELNDGSVQEMKGEIALIR